MIFKYKNAKERNVGNNMTIKDLYAGKNMPIDFVLIPINAEHSIEGDVEFAIMCMPSFDIDKEQTI